MSVELAEPPSADLVAVDLPKHKLLRGDFRVRSLGGDPRTMGGARVTVREGN